MSGYKIKCPNCTRICFETTDQFNPNVPPHGGMVKFLLQYHIDWLCVPTTKASEMCCPECLAPLVVGDVLNVIMPIREAGEAFHDVLTEDQKNIIQEGEIKKEQLKTSVQMEVPEGVTVIPEPDNPNIIPAFICDVCGKECKNQFGLNSHKKSHKGGK